MRHCFVLRRAYECNYRCPCAERLRDTTGKNGEVGIHDCGLRASQVGLLLAFVRARKYDSGVRSHRYLESVRGPLLVANIVRAVGVASLL